MEVVLLNTRAIPISLLMFNIVALAFGTNPTRVLTQQGYVKGIRQDIQIHDGQTKTIYKFLGIPYVEKPIGEHDLRFKPPQALSTQRSIDYDATFLRPVCMQDEFYFDSIRGAWPEFDRNKDMSEDCLYLNIYTPNTRGTRKYPVFFYIHGGGFFSGTPIRDISPSEYLPTRDVVLVTIQYRLGIFGFFTTGDTEAPGNLGLLDQVEALKWVQQNIEGFGGDKNSVTLLGEGSGGSSVGLHYLSPRSERLFNRGIAISGVDLSPFAYKPRSKVLGYSKKYVKTVNCTKNSSRLIVQCLQSGSSKFVYKNSNLFYYGFSSADKHFLTDDPKILREKGIFHKLPLLSGFVSQEGSFEVAATKKNPKNDTSMRKDLKGFFEWAFDRPVNESRAAFDALISQYTPAINNASEYRNKLVDVWSDYLVIPPTHAAMTFHSDHGAPSFMFEFAHRSKHHPKPKWMGVQQADAIAYMFGLPLLRSNPTNLTFDDNDRNISDMVVTMFIDFAKFDCPTPFPFRGVQWTPFNSVNKAYLKIQSNPVMARNYHPQRMAFWNSRLPKLFSNDSSLKPSTEPDSLLMTRM